jgi:hypothetical protein
VPSHINSSTTPERSVSGMAEGDVTSAPEKASEILRLSLESDWKLEISVSPWLIGLAMAAAVAVAAYRWYAHRTVLGKNFEIDEAEFGLGNSKIVFRPNDDDRRVAYQIWVELSTRKIGLPIDADHDVVAEIYDSWHTFFTVTRELIKEIPISRVRTDSTPENNPLIYRRA